MNALRLVFLAAALALPAMAMAQWQWIDKDGRKVFSDQPPPPGIPEANILKQPGRASGSANTAVPAPAAAPVAAAQPAAPVPKLSGKEKELEARRKAAEAAEAEKKKAKDEEIAAARADNCKRAKQAKATFDSGVRVAITNAKGEKEFLDENQRAAEVKRLQGLIARDCS